MSLQKKNKLIHTIIQYLRLQDMSQYKRHIGNKINKSNIKALQILNN